MSAAHISPGSGGGIDPNADPSGLSFHGVPRASIHSRRLTSQYRYVVVRLEETVAELARVNSIGPARVLDYGCALRPYRGLFGSGVTYVGADLKGNALADIVLKPDGSVPEPDHSFDLVLSTQVLEHVSDPAGYLLECFRVLRPGGSLVLTTHGLMYWHPDPHDFWRWTPEGLVKLVAEAGFAVSETRGVLGLASASLQLLQDSTARHLPRGLRQIYVAVMQQLVALADRQYSSETRARDALVLAISATRPAETRTAA